MNSLNLWSGGVSQRKECGLWVGFSPGIKQIRVSVWEQQSYGHGKRLCSNSRQGKVNTKTNVSGSMRWVGKHYCHHKNPSWKGKIKWRRAKPAPQQAFWFWAGGCSRGLLTELTEALCPGPFAKQPMNYRCDCTWSMQWAWEQPEKRGSTGLWRSRRSNSCFWEASPSLKRNVPGCFMLLPTAAGIA